MKTFFVFIFSIISFSVSAQKEITNWFFGRYAGLDFSNGTPVQLFGSPSISFEGQNCSAISDKNGNILFYSDGYSIINRNNQIMSGFNSGNTSYSIIIPKPGSNNLFYLFLADQSLTTPGLRYTIVDMNLNGGLGNTTTPSQLLSSSITWVFASVKHNNGKDVWLVAHEFNSNRFLAYLITSSGISTPTITSIGNTYSGNPHYSLLKSFKISPDGKKGAIAFIDNLDVFDFNNLTGKVSNPISLTNFINPYGIEFSPDSKRLYVGASESQYHEKIFQIDLSSTDPLSIRKSITLISSCTAWDIASIQLGPDGKIYVAYNNDFRFIGVINDPNELGGACFYQDTVIFLITPIAVTGVGTNGALSNFVSSYFQPIFTYTHTCITDSTILSISDTNGIAMVKWDFGDPGSGIANYSTDLNPKHKFSTAGNFNVKLTLFFADGSSEFYYYNVYIKSSLSSINIGKDSQLCHGGSLPLNPCYQGVSYQWSDGSHNPYYFATVSDTIWLEISNACGTVRDTIIVNFQPPPPVNLGNDTLVCSGSQLLLDVSATGYSYKWKDGSSLSLYLVTHKDTIWVEVSLNNCSNSDSISINYINPPSVNFGNDTVLCTGEHLTLSVLSELTSYLWDDASTEAHRTISSSEKVWVQASNKCGTVTDTIQVGFLNIPSFSIGNDTSLCFHDSLELKLPTGYTYHWQDGSTQMNYLITTAGTYQVTANNQCGSFTVSKTIKNIPCCSPFIPNLLTVNNDGQNEEFIISCIEDGQWKLEVFNRWGDRVFLSNDYHNELNGAQLDEGIYYYALSKQGKNTYKGWLQVTK